MCKDALNTHVSGLFGEGYDMSKAISGICDAADEAEEAISEQANFPLLFRLTKQLVQNLLLTLG